MLLSTLYIFSFSIAISLAQSTTINTISSTVLSSAAATTHTIAVGAAGFTFTPNILYANVSDIIEFRFYPTNHSVAEAEFGYPCIPYEDTGPNKVGFWSGFQPLNVVLQNPPNFQVRINDTNPLFYYCSAPGACINDGMVGVINPNATETFNAQLAFAKNSTVSFSPGEYFPAEGVLTTTSAIPSPTSISSSMASSTISAAASSSTTAAAVAAVASSGSPPLSTGAIAGIAVGVGVIVILAGAVMYLYGRQRTIKDVLHQSERQSQVTFRPDSGQLTTLYEPGYLGNRPNVDSNSVSGARYSALGVAGYNGGSPARSDRSKSPLSMGGIEVPNWSAVERSSIHPSFGASNLEPGSEVGMSAHPRSVIPRRMVSAGRGPHELETTQEDYDEAMSPESRPFSFREEDDRMFGGYVQREE